jgi:hypothetical protein
MVFVIVAVVVEGGGEYAGRTAVGAAARCWDGGRARAKAWIPCGGRALRAQGCGDGFGAADWGRGWKRLRPRMERRRIAGAARGVLAAGRTGTMCTPTLRTYRVVEINNLSHLFQINPLQTCPLRATNLHVPNHTSAYKWLNGRPGARGPQLRPRHDTSVYWLCRDDPLARRSIWLNQRKI